jgi:hypothetical protein
LLALSRVKAFALSLLNCGEGCGEVTFFLIKKTKMLNHAYTHWYGITLVWSSFPSGRLGGASSFFLFFLIKKETKIKKKRFLPASVQLIIAFFQGSRTVNDLHFSAVLYVKYFE